ncbi:MAG: Na+/H+ antiporter NhaA [Actinobacteria bacterium]|nr:Na+/H+ antiporter NhaA [Actinomycetota bacterium]
MRAEAAGGVLMLLAAVVAIIWANSGAGDSYFGLFGTTIEIAVGDFSFHHLSELTVREWINDGLMALFFFVVGLEIKRELVVGELRDPRAAALPAIAALGGMLLPALIYTAFNASGPGARGWGIPMATDIAFAVGIVSMLGRRVPVAAKLFLLALAIVDDLGAIIVIALFYTSDLAAGWLAAGIGGLGFVAVMRRLQVRAVSAYVLVGVFVWLAILESGVHATVAGVAMALFTPTWSFYSPRYFAPRARQLVDRADHYLPEDEPVSAADHHSLERLQALMHELRRLSRESLPPLNRLEHALAPWASMVIVPLFALANAGVVIERAALRGAFDDPVLLGTAAGLVVGKLLGVTTFAWLAIKLGLGRMPARTTWRHMVGLGMLAGIGFTVALFVAALSFPGGSAEGDSAKLGIFAASAVAGIAGYCWLRFASRSRADALVGDDGVADPRTAERVGA